MKSRHLELLENFDRRNWHDPVETVAEVAAYVRMHPKTLYRLLRQGKGPVVVRLTPHRIGIRVSAKEAWLAQCSIEPNKERP